MELIKPRGCGTALITPFTSDGAVDYEAFKRLLRSQQTYGVDFVVVLGSTAETPCLTTEERLKLVTVALNTVKIPIWVGVGANSTAEVLHNVDIYARLDIAGYLVVTPYYNKPTQQGLYEHFAAIAAQATKPLLLYNVPGRTGCNLLPETVVKLAELPKIVGIKEASGDIAQIDRLLQLVAGREFSVISGNDDQTFPLMALGADGVISVASNLAPKLCAKMVHALLENNLGEALKLHRRLSPLFKACFVETNPIPVKAGYALLDKHATALMRLPLTKATDKTTANMREVLNDLRLI